MNIVGEKRKVVFCGLRYKFVLNIKFLLHRKGAERKLSIMNTTEVKTTETTKETTVTTAANEIFTEIVGNAAPTSPQITAWAWRVAQLPLSDLESLCNTIVAKSFKKPRAKAITDALPTVAAVMAKVSSIRKKIQMEKAEKIAPFNPLEAINLIYYSFTSVKVVNEEAMIFKKVIVETSLDLTKIFPEIKANVNKLVDGLIDNTRHELEGEHETPLPFTLREARSLYNEILKKIGINVALKTKTWKTLMAGAVYTNSPYAKGVAKVTLRPRACWFGCSLRT